MSAKSMIRNMDSMMDTPEKKKKRKKNPSLKYISGKKGDITFE